MDAFLQEEDPAQVFLPLEGGTMTGVLDVATNNITGVYSIRNSSDLEFINGDAFGLYASDGSTSIDWGSRMLIDPIGQNSLDWYFRRLTDGSEFTSIDWSYRQLFASDGTTVMLDWSTAGSINLYNNILNAGSIGYDVYGAYGGSGAFYDPLFENSNGRFFDVDGYANRSTALTLTLNTVSTLSSLEGTVSYVTDADTPVIGLAVVGSGSSKCLVCYNGTDHIVTSLL